jgi:hypothetical protein
VPAGPELRLKSLLVSTSPLAEVRYCQTRLTIDRQTSGFLPSDSQVMRALRRPSGDPGGRQFR